eukprot:sb/3474247/
MNIYVITNERDRIGNYRYRSGDRIVNFRYLSSGPDGTPRSSTKFCLKTRHATLTLKRYPQNRMSKQPIRTRYLGHVTGYQPIRDQCWGEKKRVSSMGDKRVSSSGSITGECQDIIRQFNILDEPVSPRPELGSLQNERKP